MYEEIKRLVEEDKLTFACHHRTNMKGALEEEKEWFLKRVERLTSKSYRKDEKLILEEDYCFDCGKRINYYLEGDALVPDTLTCFNEKEVVVTIPVPSGELMLDDWLEHATDLLEYLDENTYDVNCKKVRAQRTIDYAEVGIGHFFVGGNSPYVYEKKQALYIGRGEDNDDIDWDLDADYPETKPIVEGAEEVGRVYNELSWVTAVDRSIYENIAIEKYGEEEGKRRSDEAAEKADVVLKVEPGNYHITYYTNVNPDFKLYAKIEKVG